ncbi:39S ribosomal protein L47, mitochondrial [Varanus komodoensis]|nr:39S ribosomal protein L47, mitochondrial [Varanus komodoensis]
MEPVRGLIPAISGPLPMAPERPAARCNSGKQPPSVGPDKVRRVPRAAAARSRTLMAAMSEAGKLLRQNVAKRDSWTVEQLRGKSSEDLHKLWFVLLKERNMLLTLEQEAKRQRLPMPSPERLDKVKKSMERMDLVVQEREDALRLLQTGQEKERPGEWRYDFLGRPFWLKFEKYLRIENRKKVLQKKKEKQLMEKFPHLAKQSNS